MLFSVFRTEIVTKSGAIVQWNIEGSLSLVVSIHQGWSEDFSCYNNNFELICVHMGHI